MTQTTQAVLRVLLEDPAAPPVDVSLNDSVVAPALTEPGSAAADVPAASYQVSVWSPGSPLPRSWSNVPTRSRSGRATSRMSSHACVTASRR